MQKNYPQPALVLGVCLLAGAAQAQESVPVENGWYAGAGIGVSRATIDQARILAALNASSGGGSTITVDERDRVFKLILGKAFNRNVSIEGSYYDLGSFSFDASAPPAGRLSGNVKFRGLAADLLAKAFLTPNLAAYARLGGAYTKADVNFTGNRLDAVTRPWAMDRRWNPKGGLGLEWRMSPTMALRTEIERYRVDDAVHNTGTIDALSVSLVFNAAKAQAVPRPAPAPAPAPAPEPAPVAAAPAPPPPPPVPPPAPVPVSEKVSFAAEALFDFDKSVVKPEGKAALDGLLAKLAGMNTEVMVTVGHTDSVGTDKYNQALSERRAQAVKAYLMTQGVAAERIYTEGKGEKQPVADNATDAGRAKNRRVTVEVVGSRN